MGIARETAVRVVDVCFGSRAVNDLPFHEVKKAIDDASFDFWTKAQLRILR